MNWTSLYSVDPALIVPYPISRRLSTSFTVMLIALEVKESRVADTVTDAHSSTGVRVGKSMLVKYVSPAKTTKFAS